MYKAQSFRFARSQRKSLLLGLSSGAACFYLSTLVRSAFQTRDATVTVGTSELHGSSTLEMHVAVVKACLGPAFEGITRISLDNGLRYARTHHYEFHEVNETTFPEATFFIPPAWVKIAYLHSLLGKDMPYRWILWLDCDVLILKLDVSVQSILNELNVTTQHELIFTEDDPQNKMIAPFNSGVVLARNSRWVYHELAHVLRMASQQEIRNHGLWEQEALRRLHVHNEHDEQNRFLISPMRWKFNAFDRLAEERADTVMWHRTACRKQPECDGKFIRKAAQIRPLL